MKSTAGQSTTYLVMALALIISGIVGFVGLLAGTLSREGPQEAGEDDHLTGSGPQMTRYASGVDFLGYSDQLDKREYQGTKLGGLSGLAYDSGQDLYYAVVDGKQWDSPARFYTLHLPLDHGRLGDPQILGVTFLRDPSGRPYTGKTFDGEGIAITRSGELFVASETEPSIRHFSLDGRFLAQLRVPRKFLVAPEGQARSNMAFESLSISPDGRSLFTALQYPLIDDGRISDERKRIRLLRYKKRGSAGFQPSEEFFYLTAPGNSLTDIFVLSERELLALEGHLIFRVSLDEAEDVSGEKALATSEAVPLEKEILVSLGDCPLPGGYSYQHAPFESLELGKSLPGGRRMLVVVSDDNFDSNLETRVIALSVRMRTSTPLPKAPTC